VNKKVHYLATLKRQWHVSSRILTPYVILLVRYGAMAYGKTSSRLHTTMETTMTKRRCGTIFYA